MKSLAQRKAAAKPVMSTKSASASSGEEAAQWFDHLPKGAIEYKIPATMYWKEASTVTVIIQGHKADSGSALAGASGSGTLKVSDRMKVVITSPDHPDEFSFQREPGTEEIQYVPVNGSATWNWSVTPVYTGKKQRLEIAAWVLYPGQDDKYLRQLPAYSANIDVHIPGVGECLKRLIEGDPDYWIHYGLPGGGGFVFVAGLVTGILKRKQSQRKKNLASVSS